MVELWTLRWVRFTQFLEHNLHVNFAKNKLFRVIWKFQNMKKNSWNCYHHQVWTLNWRNFHAQYENHRISVSQHYFLAKIPWNRSFHYHIIIMHYDHYMIWFHEIFFMWERISWLSTQCGVSLSQFIVRFLWKPVLHCMLKAVFTKYFSNESSKVLKNKKFSPTHHKYFPWTLIWRKKCWFFP